MEECMFSVRPRSVDFDEVWGELRPSVINIINLQPISRLSWDHKFSDVYDICVAIPDSLSDRLYKELVQCLEEHVSNLYERISQVQPSQLLQEYEHMWTIYYKGVFLVHNLFRFLNKEFVVGKRTLDPEVAAQYAPFLQRQEIKEVGCMALDIWKTRLIRPILRQLMDLLLAAIAEDRAGRPPASKTVIQGVIMSFVQVEQFEFGVEPTPGRNNSEPVHEFYQQQFEIPFLKATEEYFSLSAQQLLADLSCSQYMDAVIEAIDSEQKRSSGYVHKSSVEKVIKMCQNVMISAHRDKLNGVCSDLIKNEERADLHNMYKLLKLIPHGLTVMIKEFEEYAKKKGTEATHGGDPATVPQQIVKNVLLNSTDRDKFNEICRDLIKNEDRTDLHNMYKLLKLIPHGLTVMIKEFEEYVKKKGTEAVATQSGDPATPQQFVENVLLVYDKYNEMKNTVFMGDGDFSGALDKALQSVVNARIPGSIGRSSDKLARYSDSLVRKSARVLSESELDEKLSRAIVIFRYIEDKDIFQKYYSKMLSSRLIYGLSVSLEAEELMINKLKQACGYEFTCKLSRMFTDINICPEMGEQFNKFVSEKERNLPTQMQPVILTAGSWPLTAPCSGGSGTPASHLDSVSFVLPRELKTCVDTFEEYYTTKHNGRKLNWLYHTSHGDLRTNYLAKPHIIQASVFQMAVLLLFNHKDSYKMSDLSVSVGLTDELFQKLMRTLIDSNMLTCVDKDLTDTSVLNLNMGLQSKRMRFKLPSVQSTKQTVDKDVEQTMHTISQDRKCYIECAVVRIMKTRKVLKHAILVTEVMDQIKGRFKPDVVLVKKCIEDLIDKLYLQRTDQNDEYQYLA